MPASAASQQFVPITEIRDGIAMLKDGSLRMVVMASSINLALKSPDEQEAVIAQFQNFLNSLDFPVQIFAQSRKLDIRGYIGQLEEAMAKQTIDLMQIQIKEYIGFVQNIVETANIMSKSFFVIVPFTPPALSSPSGFIDKLLGSKQSAKDMTATFEQSRSQLEQRVSIVEQGLSRCGVRTFILGTEELVELYYKLFNPGDLQKPSLNQVS